MSSQDEKDLNEGTEKPKKATKAEINNRVNQIADMILQGFTRAQILQFITEKTTWEISERTADYYIRKARDKFETDAEINRRYELGRAMKRLDDLYRRNMAIQDYKAALSVQKERSTLTGLYSDKVQLLLGPGSQVNLNQDAPRTKVTLRADQIAGSFSDIYRDITRHAHTEYVMYGGRGSTKSSFTALEIIELITNNPTWHALVVRQYSNTLRNSVYSQLLWAIDELDLTDQFDSTVSPLEITYKPTGQKIYFRGADDPNKIKSIKTPFGAIGILWFEELDQLQGEQAVRKIEQSAIRGTDTAYIFKTFNPPPTVHNWANKYVRIPKENQYLHESNYLQVPKEWLGRVFLDEAEHLKEINPDAYNHEYLGVPTLTGGTVFPNVELRELTDQEIAGYDRLYYGLDWGYALDPLHWIKAHYDSARETLYIFDELRALKMSNQELATILKDQKGMTEIDLLIADSAEPKSIADMVAYGLLCRGAEKGPDSVRYRIRWMQNRAKIVIDPKRCPHAAQEWVDYQYETTRDGEFVSQYPDKNNHSIDATCYALNTFWRKRGQ